MMGFGGSSSHRDNDAGGEEEPQQKSLMGSLFASTARMASKAVGGSPEAELELSAPPNQRLYFENGDEISGALSLEVPNEI